MTDEKEFEGAVRALAGTTVAVSNQGADDKTRIIVYLRFADGTGVSQSVGNLKKGSVWSKNLGASPCIGASIAWTDAHDVPRLINLPNDAGLNKHSIVAFNWTSSGRGEVLDVRW